MLGAAVLEAGVEKSVLVDNLARLLRLRLDRIGAWGGGCEGVVVVVVPESTSSRGGEEVGIGGGER